MKTEKERTREVGNEESYSATLEAYYSDLLLKEKAGRISSASHQALDTFLRELRELVAESQAAQLPKAA